MRPAVTIFDLYGTLVDGFSYSQHERALVAMTETLQTPDPRAFALSFTHDTWLARGTGQFPSIEANIAWIYEEYRWPLDTDRMAEALQTLKRRGHRLGLISDCSAETPEIWPSLPFAPLIEQPVFSCAVGYLKPDPRIYQIACERLGVAPTDCLYIGDRPEEVIGARGVGMRAIRVRPPRDDTYEAREPDRPVWDGPELESVAQVPAALDDLTP